MMLVALVACFAGTALASLRGNPRRMNEYGYQYMATSTQFGTGSAGACGGITLSDINGVDGYIAIAAAQSMMGPYSDECSYDSCDGTCNTCPSTGMCDGQSGGCTCKQTGGCNCGSGEDAAAANTDTASLGCWKCATGRVLKQSPYTSWDSSMTSSCSSVDSSSFLTDDVYKFVVGDTCPYGSNAKWCPYTPGDVNQCGFSNHFDIGDASPIGSDWNNNFIVFNVTTCSDTLIAKINELSPSSCPASTSLI